MRQLHRRATDRNRQRLLSAGWQMACHVQGDAGVDHHPRRLRRGAAPQPARRSPTAPRARRRDPARPAPASRRSRVTCSIFVDQIHYWGDIIVAACSERNADLVGCQRDPRWPPACASRCTTIHRSHQRSRCATSRGGDPNGAERPGAGAGGAADRRAGDPCADHRRCLAVVRRRCHRLAGSRQIRGSGGCCQPIPGPCRPSGSPIRRARDVSGGSPGLTSSDTELCGPAGPLACRRAADAGSVPRHYHS